MRSKLIPISIIAALALGFSTLEAGNIIDLTKTNNATPQSNYGKNEVIILFKKGAKIPNSFFRIIKKFTHHQFNLANAMYIKSGNMSTNRLMKFFKSSKFSYFIKRVEPNFAYKPLKTSDSYYDKLWAVENNAQSVNGESGTKDADMDINEAWSKEKGSSDVIVAVLDTGVDYNHADLSDNMYKKLAKHGYDFAGDDDGNNDNDPIPDTPYDENGHYHGTHVAGIIGAVGDNGEGVSGVNQNVQILALKVFRPNGYGYTSDILEALDYVGELVDNGDNIVAINASYGGSGGSQDDATNEAIKKLGEKGVVFCAAAGNDGKNIDNDPVYPASYNASNIIAVAASDQDDKLASFSNYGKNSVDVAAPGTNILSTYPDNQYAYLQGTSMATPYVTGMVALIKAYSADTTVNEMVELVKNSVDTKSDLTNKVASNGRVNVNNALNIQDDNNNGGGNNNGGDEDGGEQDSNTPPSAKDDSAITDEDKSVTVNVLTNDSDADNDSLSVVSVSNPEHGSVTKNSDNTITYTPHNNYNGSDSFSYTISDGNGAEASATVNITVNAVNDAPTAQDDSAKTDEDEKVTIDVLANDSDIDGDTLTIKSITSPNHGSAKVVNSKIEYTPDSGYSGDDSFNYTISDGNGAEATAKVSVTIEKKNDDNSGNSFGGLFSGGGWFW